MRTVLTLMRAGLMLCLLSPLCLSRVAAAPAADHAHSDAPGVLRAVKSYDADFEVLSTQPATRVLPRVVPRFTPPTPGHLGHMLPLGPLLPPTILDGQVVVRPRATHRAVSVVVGHDDNVLVLQASPPKGGSADSAPITFAAMRFDAAGMTVTVTAAATVFRDHAGRSLTVNAAPL